MSQLADYQLSPRLRQILSVAAPVIVGEGVLRAGLLEGTLHEAELFLRSVPTPVRAGLIAGALSFDQAARLKPSSLGRSFAQLPAELAAEHYASWWESPLGALHQLARGLKMMLTMAYYEQPEVRAELGYTPEAWIAKVKERRLNRFQAEIEAHERELLEVEPLRAARGRRLPSSQPAAGQEAGA